MLKKDLLNGDDKDKWKKLEHQYFILVLGGKFTEFTVPSSGL